MTVLLKGFSTTQASQWSNLWTHLAAVEAVGFLKETAKSAGRPRKSIHFRLIIVAGMSVQICR